MNQVVRIPNGWIGKRIYFCVMPSGVIVKESISLKKKDAKKKCEKWANCPWAYLQLNRYYVESVRSGR